MLKRLAILLFLTSVALGDLQSLTTEISLDKDYKDLTDNEWDAKTTYRGLHERSQIDFDYLENLYPKKIEHARLMIATEKDVEMLAYWVAKEARMLDKLACVIEEQRLRKEEFVVRLNTHEAADYYIDYVGGNDSSAGTATGTAWKTISKYTTTTARVPGDRAFLRAAITWNQGTEATDIVFDEDGSIDAYISIIGCDSVTNDPWGDASDVKPIIDFEDASYNILLSTDDYWWLERLDVKRCGDGVGCVYIQISNYVYFKDCDFSDNASAGGVGINGIQCIATIDGCTLEDIGSKAVYVQQGGYCFVKDTTITAGTGINTDKAFEAEKGGMIDAVDCTLVATFATADCFAETGSTIRLRNVNLSGKGNNISTASILLSEDNDATFEAQVTTYPHGTITRGTTSPRGGGADSFAIMAPDADCGLNVPLRLGDRVAGFARAWKTAGSYTATVYARVDSAWDSALSASEAYMITSELDNAGTAARVERQSAQTIDNDTTWTAFTTSISPAREGWVYFWFYLAEYEDATEKVDVDIKVSAS